MLNCQLELKMKALPSSLWLAWNDKIVWWGTVTVSVREGEMAVKRLLPPPPPSLPPHRRSSMLWKPSVRVTLCLVQGPRKICSRKYLCLGSGRLRGKRRNLNKDAQFWRGKSRYDAKYWWDICIVLWTQVRMSHKKSLERGLVVPTVELLSECEETSWVEEVLIC